VNFLVDAQLPPGLARWLADQGHLSPHVNDVGLAGAEDFVIWNHALGVDAIIVTKDEDFAERTARTAIGPVIVWLRIGTLRTVPFSNGLNRVDLLSFNLIDDNRLIEVR
jgi:predicted nuclease of predicted toxin-antitoxin system